MAIEIKTTVVDNGYVNILKFPDKSMVSWLVKGPHDVATSRKAHEEALDVCEQVRRIHPDW